MEKRIVKKCEDHLHSFKENIKKWFDENDCEIIGRQNTGNFLNFIFDFENLHLSKEDFVKRKRIKNFVPINERCCACRANGEQCTRRKQEGINYCGTHFKGTPHGTIKELENTTQNTTSKNECIIEDIGGLLYYIDAENNIYKTEDVLSNKLNPSIIGKRTFDESNNSIIKYF